MASVLFVRADGSTREVAARVGQTVMEVAVANGIGEILGECGGSAVCGTCHVFVAVADLASLPPRLALEHELLDSTAVTRRPNSRLGCQIVILRDDTRLTMHLPETQI
jgi:ferredoxin, 2Fe-2S